MAIPGRRGAMRAEIDLMRHEAARRDLSEAEILEVVGAQVREREQAAEEYDGLGQHDAAQRLRDEAEALRRQLAG
jgi:uncharacterized protein YqeY